MSPPKRLRLFCDSCAFSRLNPALSVSDPGRGRKSCLGLVPICGNPAAHLWMTSRSCPIRQDGLKSPSLFWNSAREVQSPAILRLLRTDDADGRGEPVPRTYFSPVIAAAEVGGALTRRCYLFRLSPRIQISPTFNRTRLIAMLSHPNSRCGASVAVCPGGNTRSAPASASARRTAMRCRRAPD